MLADEPRRHRSAGDDQRCDQSQHEPGLRDEQNEHESDQDSQCDPHGGRLSLPWPRGRCERRLRRSSYLLSLPVSSTARKAFCGISTEPIDFIRFLPSRCLAHSLRLRVMSPP